MRKIFIILTALIGLSYSQDQFPEFPIYPDFLFIPEVEETASYTYQAESLALFARMSVQPSEERKQLIDGLIVDFKNASLWELGAFWSGMDAVWSFAAHDQTAAPLNWIEDDHNCTEVNSPAFEVDRGYTGNGSDSYLNTTYNPATDAVNFTQNDASAGIYIRSDVAAGTQYDIGVREFFVTHTLYINSYTGAVIRGMISNIPESDIQVSVGTSVGLTVFNRTSSNNVTVYKNGASLGNFAKTSGSHTSADIFICGMNSDGVITSASTRQVAFGFIGRNLTANEQSTLFTLVEAYLDAIGAGVVE